MRYIKPLCAALLTAIPMALFTSHMEAKELHKDVSQINKPATIKIRVAEKKKQVLLEVKGRYQIYNPADSVLVDTGILGRRDHITFKPEGFQWADVLPIGLDQFRIVPGDSQCKILIDGIQYLGCVEVHEEHGQITIINELDVENYLKSTLAPIFSAEKNQELLDAVAITARTNTYYHVGKTPHAMWHVDAVEVGYAGFALANQNARLDRSIDNTKHMVMTHHKTPFVALWTKDSAGKTASSTTILRKETNSPQGVQIPIALRDREKRTWQLTITKEQLAQIAGVNHINAVDLFLDQTSGKVYALRIHDGFTTKDIDFFTLQKALGAKKMRSNDFTLNVKNDNILISGFGEGPGVGLCLYSARIMAEHGDKAPKILATFFPETELERKREI
jgi:stage II sporulation protein D